MSAFNFLKQFICDPQKVGAVAPSSCHLAEMITECAHLNASDVIVELGPGTGVFTTYIARKKTENSVFFALELNTEFAEMVKENNPDVPVYCDCASCIDTYLEKHNVEKADTVISGLPWAAFPAQLQDKILNGVVDSLKDDGSFLTFAYLQGLLLPSGMRFRKVLEKKFRSVRRSPIVWRNIPPAFVYICKK